MARAALTVESSTSAGLEPTQTAIAADGHSFVNDSSGKTFVIIENGATGFTLTVATPLTVDGLAVTDRTVTVGANETWVVGPFAKSTYNQSDGTVYLDYSDVTDGTVGVVKLA